MGRNLNQKDEQILITKEIYRAVKNDNVDKYVIENYFCKNMINNNRCPKKLGNRVNPVKTLYMTNYTRIYKPQEIQLLLLSGDYKICQKRTGETEL